MASLISIAITSFLLVFLISFPPTTLSQSPATIAACAPRLLPLTPCAPFVQNSVPRPGQSCCDSVKQLYDDQPDCLCFLLNDTTLASSFPMNRTLALELPFLCNIQVNTSTCSGVPLPPAPPPSPDSQVASAPNTNPSPDSQAPSALNSNSSVAASPKASVAPRTSIMGFGFGQSAGVRLQIKGNLEVMVMAATAFLLTKGF